MSPYFVLRQGSNSITADELSDDVFSLTYTDSDGKVVEGIPNKVGTYTVKAEFKGNDTYHAFVETVANDEYDWGPAYGNYKEAARKVDLSGLDLGEYYLAKTRNWTTFTIKASSVDKDKEDQKAKIKKVKTTVTLSTKDVKKGIKVTVKVPEAQKADKTGIIIYRSLKKDSGYVTYKKVATKGSTLTYKNTLNIKGKSLTKGKTYYYKAQAYKVIDGKTYYGPMSAIKSIKAK